MTAEPGSLLNVISTVASERARNSSIGSSVVDVFSMTVGFSGLSFSFLLANGRCGKRAGSHRQWLDVVTYYISRTNTSLLVHRILSKTRNVHRTPCIMTVQDAVIWSCSNLHKLSPIAAYSDCAEWQAVHEDRYQPHMSSP